MRAIDFHEGDMIDEAGLKALILEAVKLNTSKGSNKTFVEGDLGCNRLGYTFS